MNRAARRRDERHQGKLERKLYTYQEMFNIVHATVEDVKAEYDILYTTALATALNAEPINFGKKRVCRVVDLVFGQITALHKKVLDQEEIIKEAEKLGVFIKKHADGKLEVIIDPDIKEEKND